MYIVGFNGPPESGKDSLAEGLMAKIEDLHNIPTRVESLSFPLRSIAYAMVGWQGELDGPDYARFKRTVFPAFGVNGRQLMIDVSEDFLKTKYGTTIMARLLLDRLAGFQGLVLLRDSGFQIEVNPLVDAIGSANFYIARCHRPGKTFEGDSRESVFHPYRLQKPNGSDVSLDGDYYNDESEFIWKTDAAAELYGVLTHNLGWKL